MVHQSGADTPQSKYGKPFRESVFGLRRVSAALGDTENFSPRKTYYYPLVP